MQRVLICCLLCVCSAGMAVDVLQPVLYDQLRKDVEKLMNVPMKNDTEDLHTPINMKKDCRFIAVSCFINATLFLKPVEHPTGNKIFNETISRIQSISKDFFHIASEQKCPRCTNYPKQSPKDFLGKFQLLLQQLYRNSVSS